MRRIVTVFQYRHTRHQMTFLGFEAHYQCDEVEGQDDDEVM